MQREYEDWQHDYRATPLEYPISDNNRPATYDQFISLRDTLVMSNKYYADSAWRSLIIWTKLNGNPTWTIEIRKPNSSRQSFEPWYESDSSIISPDVQWEYITIWWWTTTQNPLACTIQKDWRYKLTHKEQFVNIDSSITRIHTYILHTSGSSTVERAVFDWERDTAWEIKRMTAFGYVECNLKKWDVLELKMEDQDWTHIDSASWKLQTNSNWWNIEYIDLPY